MQSIRPQASPVLRLRDGPFGMTARCRHGVSHPCPFGERRGLEGRNAQQRDMVGNNPAPRGAVKVREATAKRLDLDGEHGAGNATQQ
jgi:hypothetical protein